MYGNSLQFTDQKRNTVIYIYRCSLYKHLTLDLQTALNMQARFSPVLSVNHPGIIYYNWTDIKRTRAKQQSKESIFISLFFMELGHLHEIEF